jgi:hypothetical protein
MRMNLWCQRSRNRPRPINGSQQTLLKTTNKLFVSHGGTERSYQYHWQHQHHERLIIGSLQISFNIDWYIVLLVTIIAEGVMLNQTTDPTYI